MSIATYDNPDTWLRECWQDGRKIAHLAAEVLHPGFNGDRSLFIGLSVGPWNLGQLIGDADAMIVVAPLELTDWFPPDVKPVHTGIYQRKYPMNQIFYSLWNGRAFGIGYKSQSAVENIRHIPSPNQNLPWRGLLVKP